MKRLILPALFLFLLVSCKKDNPFEKYQGNWIGTYSGDDTGTWNVTIDGNGNIQGRAVSDSLPNYPFNLTGTLSENGNFEAQAPVFFGTVGFEGQLTASSATGNWFNISAGLQGMWTGEKK